MTEPTDAGQCLNIADQCAATATSDLAASILVDGGNGTLRQLLNDAADAIRAGWATPQPTQAQVVNQANRPFIVRLAEDFAEECVTAGYVTTKAASYGRLMDEALSTKAQAGAVPFTNAQRERLFYNRPYSIGKGLAMADWHRVVQYVEAAHGIGIKKENGNG